MSLKTGDAKERTNLWMRKLCFELDSGPARRMMSPSSGAKQVGGMDGDGGGGGFCVRVGILFRLTSSWWRKIRMT